MVEPIMDFFFISERKKNELDFKVKVCVNW